MPKRMYPLSRVESIEWNTHVMDQKMCESIDQEDWDKHSQETIFEKNQAVECTYLILIQVVYHSQTRTHTQV